MAWGAQAKGLPPKKKKKNFKKKKEKIEFLPLFFKKFVVLAPQNYFFSI